MTRTSLRAVVGLALLLFVGAAGCSRNGGGGEKGPQAELRQLERKVSLKLAHLRDQGPTDPAMRERLHQAQELDLKAEQAIAAGDYAAAEDALVKANAILGRIGM